MYTSTALHFHLAALKPFPALNFQVRAGASIPPSDTAVPLCQGRRGWWRAQPGLSQHLCTRRHSKPSGKILTFRKIADFWFCKAVCYFLKNAVNTIMISSSQTGQVNSQCMFRRFSRTWNILSLLSLQVLHEVRSISDLNSTTWERSSDFHRLPSCLAILLLSSKKRQQMKKLSTIY